MNIFKEILGNIYFNAFILSMGIASLILAFFSERRSKYVFMTVLLFGIFLWGNNFHNDISIMTILLLVIGILLLGLEAVVPGFGLPGISGIICMITALYFLSNDKGEALIYISTSIIISAVTITYIIKSGRGINRLDQIVLKGSNNDPKELEKAESLLHKKGTALTALRPSGIVLIDNMRKSAITEGEFIDKNKKVKVMYMDGIKIVVKEIL